MVSTLNRWIVEDYARLVRENETVVLVELGRLTVQEAEQVRRVVRGAGAKLRVAKSSLAQVAFREAGVPIKDDWFQGTCGIMAGDVEAAIGAAKAVVGLWKKVEDRKIQFRGAYLDGAALGPEEAAAIPSMPDKQTVRAMLCGAIIGPARMLASLLQQLPASVARGVQARVDQANPAGESAA